jgi:hypothetical protein
LFGLDKSARTVNHKNKLNSEPNILMAVPLNFKLVLEILHNYYFKIDRIRLQYVTLTSKIRKSIAKQALSSLSVLPALTKNTDNDI